VLALVLVLGPGPADGGNEVPADPGRFEADLVVRPAGGSETHIFLQPGHGVVSLRVFVPLAESPEEAGAAQLIRALSEDRMQAMARRIGARVQAWRTPDGLAYQVSGPTSEIDFLVWILNEGLRTPEPPRFNEVRRDQLAEVLRRQETPQGALALRIRERAGGSGVPLLGSAVSLERMHAGVVSAVWARSHSRERTRIVVVGDVTPEVALSALVGLELPDRAAEPHTPPAVESGQPRLSPEIIRHWVAQAWPLDRPRDPRGLVAVGILGDRIRAGGGDYELGAELWEIGGRWTLVVSGAAYPRTQQAMRNRLGGLLAEGTQAVSDAAVRQHAARVRGDLLLQASTPWGFAELVGQALESGQRAEGLAQVLSDLESMGAAEMAAFFADLQRMTPVREEIRP
jgi:predicted Zn-dependent peptidase